MFIVDSSCVEEQRWKSVQLPNVLYIVSVSRLRLDLGPHENGEDLGPHEDGEVMSVPGVVTNRSDLVLNVCNEIKVDIPNQVSMNPSVRIRGGPTQFHPSAFRLSSLSLVGELHRKTWSLQELRPPAEAHR